jgi:hypothetical protein
MTSPPSPSSQSSQSRVERIAGNDPAAPALITRLLDLASRGLPRMRTGDDFVFTLRGEHDRDGRAHTVPAGRSLRYAAITALGAMLLPESRQRTVLAGETADELITKLVARLYETGPRAVTSLGDVALVCWAAAAADHKEQHTALDRLATMDPAAGAVYTVDAAWVVSALAAARQVTDDPAVRAHFERARNRLLNGVREGALFSHEVGGHGLVPGYRAHVGCFADQVYPIQALARAGDDEALRVADAAAERICAAQGEAGQWWWHYDARTGGVVEGYPVYSVHQHAMAPMALLDLAEAGGAERLEAIRRGLRWLAQPPETELSLIIDDLDVTWRKVARRDPKKAVRGARAVTTRARSGWRLAALDRVFPPAVVDTECRPYEFGWLLFTWLHPSRREKR